MYIVDFKNERSAECVSLNQRGRLFMAIIRQGVLGPFSGKAGAVIGVAKNGVGSIRGLSVSHKDANTEEQKEQRRLFKLVQNIIWAIRPYLKRGYKKYDRKQSPYNAFTKLVLDDCLTLEGETRTIDFSKVKVTNGTLTAMKYAKVSQESGKFVFTWPFKEENESEIDGTDHVMPLVYNIDKNEAEYSIRRNNRSSLTAEVEVPDYWKGDKVVVYLGVKDLKSKNGGPSVYLGEFTIV